MGWGSACCPPKVGGGSVPLHVIASAPLGTIRVQTECLRTSQQLWYPRVGRHGNRNVKALLQHAFLPILQLVVDGFQVGSVRLAFENTSWVGARAIGGEGSRAAEQV